MQHNVLDGFYPLVRDGCIACSRGQGGFQCGGDVYPSNHAQRTVGTLQLPFLLHTHTRTHTHTHTHTLTHTLTHTHTHTRTHTHTHIYIYVCVCVCVCVTPLILSPWFNFFLNKSIWTRNVCEVNIVVWRRFIRVVNGKEKSLIVLRMSCMTSSGMHGCWISS